MPRLLPPDLIKKIAINHLLELYEKENGFVQEWEKIRHPFVPLIEQYVKASCLIEVEHILSKSPPSDLIAWISDMHKLKKHLQGLPCSINDAEDLSEIQREGFQEQIRPYIHELKNLAYKWNLRACWAGNELMARDIYKAQQVYVVSYNETIRPQKIINTLEAMLPGSSIIISSGS